jgi:hypothetical protein
MAFLNPMSKPFQVPGSSGQQGGEEGSAHALHGEPSLEMEDGEVMQISELMDRLLLGSKDDPAELGYTVAVASVLALERCSFTKRLRTALSDMANPLAREGALHAIVGLIGGVGRAAEPFIVPLLPLVYERMADKVVPVRDAAVATGAKLAQTLSPESVPLVLPLLFDTIANPKSQWQSKEGALKALKQFAATAPDQIATALTEIVPKAGECLIDPREQVKKAAWLAMSAAFKLNGNRDIEPCVAAMLSCIARPAEVGDTISKLSATTFVQVWGDGGVRGVQARG